MIRSGPAAIEELDDRYAATLSDSDAAVHGLARQYFHACVAGDVAAAGTLLAPGFELGDRQHGRVGTLDRDGALEAMTMARRDPGHVMFGEEILVIGAGGSVVRMREHEDGSSGGHVDQHSLVVTTVHDGLIDRIELFPPEDVEHAMARYEELTRA